MPAGDAFSEKQSEDISRTIRLAEENSDLHYSVYVGARFTSMTTPHVSAGR